MHHSDRVIVVLGHPADEHGNPAPILKSRLDKAISLYKSGEANKIIVTGAAVYNQFVEAEVMAVYCISNNIPAEDIIMEPRARNTYENARMVKAIMIENGLSSAIVVTSAFHKKRAERFFRKAIPNVVVQVCPYPENFPYTKKLFYTLKEQIILILFQLGLLNRRYAVND